MLGYGGIWWDMAGCGGMCWDMVGYVGAERLHVVRRSLTSFAKVSLLSPMVSSFA